MESGIIWVGVLLDEARWCADGINDGTFDSSDLLISNKSISYGSSSSPPVATISLFSSIRLSSLVCERGRISLYFAIYLVYTLIGL